MIPVDQDAFGERGNCFSACVASILDLPLSEVPFFMGEPTGEWWDRFTAWATARGYEAFYLDWAEPAPLGHAIAGVPSRRYPGRMHAVVGLDGDVVHDPNPHNRTDGIAPYARGEVRDWVILVRHGEGVDAATSGMLWERTTGGRP